MRSLESHVETVLGEAVDGREVLRNDRDGVILETKGEFPLFERQNNEDVLPVQYVSCYTE